MPCEPETVIEDFKKSISARILARGSIGILSFSASTYADDIRDFEIDGMSIGDSLLDYFSRDKILNARNYDEYPSDMKFRIIDIYTENKFYEGIQFYYIPGDEKFIIQSLNGRKFFSNTSR